MDLYKSNLLIESYSFMCLESSDTKHSLVETADTGRLFAPGITVQTSLNNNTKQFESTSTVGQTGRFGQS